MSRHLSQFLAVVLALVITVTSADAAQRSRTRREEPPPPPPQFKIDVPTRPLGMDRIALSVPASAILGSFTVHTFCLANAYPVKVSDVFNRDVPMQNFIDVFNQEAIAAGYNLAGKQGSQDLFASADQAKPELIIGAAITDIKQNGCGQNIFGMINVTMDTSIAIDWQVFDPLERKLVYRVTHAGAAKLKKQLAADSIPTEAALAAFREAAKALMADANFLAAVRAPDPAGSAPAPAAPAPTSRMEIPRVPLRTATFREQIPDLRQQVVTVMTGDGMGSGFYIADGLVMTNHHVVEGARAVKIRFYGSREIPGEVLASDPRRDIALIKAPGGGMVGLPLQLERPQVGAQVYVIGSPLEKELAGTVTSGIVSAHRVFDDGPFLQSDVAVINGNSGGPMFDDKGNVVAVVVSGAAPQGSPVGLNFFIPIDDALQVLGVSMAGLQIRPPVETNAGGRAIQVSMYPADGPLKKSGKTQPLVGSVAGVGTSGTFTFTRPDGVSCDGRWTTLQSKPQSGSLIDKYRDVVGIGASPEGMVGGLAVGACSNSASFQAEYYVVPGIDSGFGAAADSDGNVYRVIF